MHIPFKAYASPDTLAHGDMIALYAGNDEPSHATTFLYLTDNGTSEVTMVTDAGRFTVPSGARVWVAAWAPLPSPPATVVYLDDTLTEQYSQEFGFAYDFEDNLTLDEAYELIK